jgi:hypothetical protein
VNKLKAVFLLCAIFCMFVVTGVIVEIGERCVKAVSDVDAVAVQAKSDAHETQLQVQDVLIKVSSTVQVMQDAATENRKYYDKAAKDSTKTVDALRLLIDRTNQQLNDGVLPQAQKAIVQFSAHSNETLDALTNSLKSLGNATDSLNKTFSDPRIPETFAHIDLMALKFSEIAGHLDNISAMGEVEVKRLTKPASLGKQIVFGGLTVAGKLGSAFSGFK